MKLTAQAAHKISANHREHYELEVYERLAERVHVSIKQAALHGKYVAEINFAGIYDGIRKQISEELTEWGYTVTPTGQGIAIRWNDPQ